MCDRGKGSYMNCSNQHPRSFSACWHEWRHTRDTRRKNCQTAGIFRDDI